MQENFKEKINDKAILITGGTGSFGNTVIGFLLKYNPKRITIFSRDEKKQFDMRNKYSSSLLKFVIGDVRDKESMGTVMDGIDYVFHAAALKQVPACEFFPIEAVKTNILGAHNVIESALKYRVKRLVILSTDKAVYPINAMGMTKALMEKVMIAQARRANETKNNDTILCGVRYGNVIYSRGSVLPYFIHQIKQNKELTVTNAEMTRFLLPLVSAVDLVFHAMTRGENGDMYVRKAPAATMSTIASAVCELFSHKKGYKEVGIRAGEKMHETLISQEELLRAENQGDYYRIPSESQGLDYNQYFLKGKKPTGNKFLSYTSENTKRLNLEETIALLKTIPEIQEELKNWKNKYG